MPTSVTSNYGGEFLEEIIVRLTEGNPTVENGNIRVHSGVNSKISIPRLKAADIILDYEATPTGGGTLTFDESEALTGSYMLYVEFDPESFASFWRPFQPTGAFVFQDLPDAVKMAIMNEFLVIHSAHIESIIWKGDTALGGGDTNRFFDGIFKKASADATVIDVATPLVLDETNIVAEILRVYKATPKAVRDHPDYKIFISTEDHEFYGDAQAAKVQKGINDWEGAPRSFKGKNLVPLPGIPKDKMLAGVASANVTSNIHFAMKFRDDATAIKAGPVANNSEMQFVKMAFKAGVVFGWGEELVAYNA